MVYLLPNENLTDKLFPFYSQMTPEDDTEDQYLEWSYNYDDQNWYYNSKKSLLDVLTAKGIDINEIEVHSYNPQGEWDWYEVGGRWKDFLLLKEGGHTDEAFLVDVAVEQMCNNNRNLYTGLYEHAMKLFGEHLHSEMTMYALWEIAHKENPSVFKEKYFDLASFRLYNKEEWYSMMGYRGVQTEHILTASGDWYECESFDPLIWSKLCYDHLTMTYPEGTRVVLVDIHN
jgi:hypothetical protein